MGFTKLDNGIITSSIWSEKYHTRILWITMLAMCDMNGFVSTSKSGLKRSANITNEEFDEAIGCLEGPDSESRSSNDEGRRVEKVEGGWRIINHFKYRKKQYVTDRHDEDYNRKGYVYFARTEDGKVKIGHSVNPWARIREIKTSAPDAELSLVLDGSFEDEKNYQNRFIHLHISREWFRYDKDLKDFILTNSNSSRNVSTKVATNYVSKSVSLSSSESLNNLKKEETIKDSDIKREEVQEERVVTWRESFDVYKQMVVDAQAVLLKDAKFFKLMEECHPNISIRLTLEKCIALFWGTEEGWKHKKKSRVKNIDMVVTLKKAAASRHNIVYKPSEFNQNAQDRATIEDKPKYDPKVWQNEYSYSKVVCAFREAVRKRHPNTWREMDEPDPQSTLWPEMWEIMISETIPKSEKWERVMKLLSDNGFDNSGLQG